MAGKRSKKRPWNTETLEDLRRRLEPVPKEAASGPTADKPDGRPGKKRPGAPKPATDDAVTDAALFETAMADVRRIPEFQALEHRASSRAPKPGRSGSATPAPTPPVRSVLDDRVDFAQTDEYIEWAAPGVRTDLCWAMHRGRIPAQDTLDLHGCTLEAARVEVDRFIRQARRRGLRCVCIVHGRGLRSSSGPVLKTAIGGWIETGPLRKRVMAYATAPRNQGGAGATYLLLRV